MASTVIGWIMVVIGALMVTIGTLFAYAALRTLPNVPNELSTMRTVQEKSKMRQALIGGVIGYCFIAAVFIGVGLWLAIFR